MPRSHFLGGAAARYEVLSLTRWRGRLAARRVAREFRKTGLPTDHKRVLIYRDDGAIWTEDGWADGVPYNDST